MKDLEKIIVTLVNTGSEKKAKQIIVDHPELLHPEADTSMAAFAMVQENAEARAAVDWYRALLKRCRAVGIERAFNEVKIPHGLESNVAEAQQLEAQRQRNPYNNSILINIYERILRTQIDEFPAFRASVQTNLGNAYFDLTTGNREANLMRAMGNYQDALRFYDPESAPREYAILQGNLGNIYSHLTTGDRTKNLTRAINYYIEALRFQTAETSPMDYARTQNNLGIAYRNLPTGNQGENLRLAIKCFREALRFYAPEIAPFEYARTQINLGIAYRNLPTGNYGDNVMRAIERYREALRYYTPEAAPFEYARTQHNLGVAYQELPIGSREANLQRSIECFLEALRFHTPESAPLDYASAQNNLGNAYRELPKGQPGVNLALAIGCFKEALRFWTPESAPRDYAMTQNNLGLAYSYLPTGDSGANFDQAIECYKKALQYRTLKSSPRDYTNTLNNLGLAYLKKPTGNREENLQHAIKYSQEALRYRTSATAPRDYAQTKTNLGNAYAHLPTGDREANLVEAIKCYQEALQFRTLALDPGGFAATQADLGNAYLFLRAGDRQVNLARAIKCFQEALRVFTLETDPEEYANTLNSLGNAHLSRITDSKDHLIQAIQCYEQALRVRTLESNPVGYATTQNNLGNAYLALSGRQETILKQAIECYQEALRVQRPETAPWEYASTQNNLGNAYQALLAGDHHENLRRAITCYQEALRFRTLEAAPNDCRKTSRNLADLYFNQQDWRPALAAYSTAMSAGERILNAGLSALSKATEVAENLAIYSKAAFAAAKLGESNRALLILERGKTHLLTEILRLRIPRPIEVPDEIWTAFVQAGKNVLATQFGTLYRAENSEPPQDYSAREQSARNSNIALDRAIARIREYAPDFLKELDLPAIQALLNDEHTALITFTITEYGCIGFSVTRNKRQGVHTVSLDRPTEDDLRRWLIGRDTKGNPIGEWLEDYFNRDSGRWHSTIERVLAKVGQRLMAPILATLPPNITKLIILPTSGLAILPLHAAFLSEDASARVCDRYLVSYAPSVEVLASLQAKAAKAHGSDLYAVVNPEQDPNLAYTSIEGVAILSLFKGQGVFHAGQAATKEAVIHDAYGRAYLHFACHGTYNWDDPSDSGLALANGRLTLADLQNGIVDLSTARVVTLSACETGLSDIFQGSADEYVGLPAGFMLSGVPSVVSSLWEVNDLSTMLLMERFYHLHLNEGEDIPTALQHAQIWLRDVTAGELAKRFAEEEEAQLAKTSDRMPIEAASDFFARFVRLNPTDQPFSHPYYWAAFTFNGTI